MHKEYNRLFPSDSMLRKNTPPGGPSQGQSDMNIESHNNLKMP